MKKTTKRFAAVILAAGLLSVCVCGCSQNDNSDNTNTTSETVSSQQESSQEVSESSEESKESSVESGQESKTDDKTNELAAIAEINILNDFRDNIQPVKEITVKLDERDGDFSKEETAKVYFVDSVIRDINDDGHYEMIVKYDGRNTQFSDYVITPSYIYDVVTVVNGKAVKTGHYENEEGWYNPGEAH